MTDLADAEVYELLDLLRRRETSPREIVKSCLARVAALDPKVNAVITLCSESALAAAMDSERRWASGEVRPLEGVPFGLKDVIATAGIRTTGGSLIYSDYVPAESATVTERLVGAGGILLAKLQTTELAGGAMQFGETRNPWNLEHMPGGSSSGSAAALAARELPLAFGTDTGGSIRNPAAYCGVCGLKPTYGRISRNGVMPLSWSLDTVGPMARSALDLALALDVTAGFDRRDPTASRVPVDDYARELGPEVRGVRIGIPGNWFFEIVDPDVEAATRRAYELLAGLGAQLVEVTIPTLDSLDLSAIHRTITCAEGAAVHESNLDRLGEFSDRFASYIVNGQFVPAVDYIKALRARTLLQADLEAMFERVDVLITPGSASTAPRNDDQLAIVGKESFPWLQVAGRTTSAFSLAGVPAVCIPSGFDRRGMPTSIQIVGRPYSEALCLRVAHTYQRVTDHHRQVPPLGSLALQGGPI